MTGNRFSADCVSISSWQQRMAHTILSNMEIQMHTWNLPVKQEKSKSIGGFSIKQTCRSIAIVWIRLVYNAKQQTGKEAFS